MVDFSAHTNLLYHYTSFESAVKILVSKELRFGNPRNFNDIAENSKRIICSPDLEASLEKTINNYYSISFTKDSSKDSKRGFAIDSQWGYYAESGKGVCLVFDKTNLRKCYKQQFRVNAIKFSNIHYSNNYLAIDWLSDGDFEEKTRRFSKTTIQRLFFEKNWMWRYENEYRMLVYSEGKQPVLCFDAKESPEQETLLGVIVYNAPTSSGLPESVEFLAIKELAKRIPVLRLSASINSMTLFDDEGHIVWTNSFFQESESRITIELD